VRKRTNLLAGAALGTLLAIGMGASAYAADAKPATKTAAKKHHAKAVAAKPNAEVEALKAEVQALEQRLAAQEQAQQQTQAQAQQAQTTAQTAADQARTIQAQSDSEIKTIPGQVQTAVAANRYKPGWEKDTQISGRMYYDLTNIEQKSNGKKVAPSGTSFDIKRFYLGVDHKFNDIFSANLTTDVAYLSADGLTQIYIKKAYLQAKLSDALIVRVGSADLPWVPFAEDVYGYRFVENTIADRDKYATSADWGVHASGKFANGVINYAVSVVNGAGYKNPTRSKGMDIEGRVNAVYDGFTVGVGGYTGKLGKDVTGVTTFHTASRFDAIAAYANKRFRVGAEYFSADDWNNVLTKTSDKTDGYSLFGSFNFTPEISAFGRYDWVKPTKDSNPNLKDHYFNIGLNYEPVKIVDFALVYKRDNILNGSLATSNGTIGGTNKGTYDEVGLFGQYRW
jgi:hypothetical protein